jgi:hypothetical protein
MAESRVIATKAVRTIRAYFERRSRDPTDATSGRILSSYFGRDDYWNKFMPELKRAVPPNSRAFY